VAFDEELRAYLEAVEQLVRHRHVDEGSLREHFRDRMRGLEIDPDLVRAHFEEWSPRIEELARYVETLPPRDAPVQDAEALAFACRALDRGLGMEPREAGMPLVDHLELGRIIGDFYQASELRPYALENRLIHREPSGKIAITALGRVFLRLRGKDAVRWLLTVEVAQSQGPRDRWRVSRELLERVSSESGIAFDGVHLPFDRNTVTRLERLGVVRVEVMISLLATRTDGRLSLLMRDVVQQVLDGGPWSAAVAALLEDERADVLPMLGSRSVDASIEQTQLIAHEVRNALVPVRHHIDALLKTDNAPNRARLESSRRGVVRVLAFIDEMVATSELLDEPATSFDVGDVIRNALEWLDGGERVELDLPIGALKLRGRRSRLQRAVSNLMLNALQATSAGQRVRAQVRRSAGMIEIVVDDDGPGVPEESRSIVFRPGFTTRGGVGGSGFGLAYVWRVVEELQGRVWCGSSDLGGARFVMALPEGEADT
jgi:signal transduction histidine kinase